MKPLASLLLALSFALPAQAALAPAAPGSPGAALRDKFGAVRERLERNDFGRPVHLDSQEGHRDLHGDIHAVMNHPFARVEAALHPAANWCEVLLLPHNTKHCTTAKGGDGEVLSIYVGRKNDTPLESTYRLDFRYRVVARTPDYLQIVLEAASGPLGTRDYKIRLEVAPLDSGRTFLHLSYAYAYGTISKLAMQAYLATMGANKVGFTSEGREADGRPRLVRGMRGVMERNTMRYFLAIDAYLDSLAVPAQARIEKRVNDWFTAAEKYPRQLHEIERDEYVAMKRREYRRLPPPAPNPA